MDADKQLSFEAFQQALSPQRMQTFQIIYGALLLGTTLFFGIVLKLYFGRQQTAEAGDASFLRILTVVHAALAAGCYVAAFAVNRFLTGPAGVKIVQRNAEAQGANDMTQAGIYLQAVFAGAIIRAALMEGAAFFGLIVCLLGVTEGVIQEQPIYWLNLFSYGIFALMILWTFPTRLRLEDQFKDRFGVI